MVKKEDIYTTVAMTKSERYLHTPGSFAKQNLLYVQEVGHLEIVYKNQIPQKEAPAPDQYD